MKILVGNSLATIALLCTTADVWAAVTCTAPVSTGFSTAYAPTGVVPNVTQGTISFSCTRTLPGDPLIGYGVRADNGANPGGGGQNQVALAGNFISYEAYRESACTNIWTRPNNANHITFSLAAVENVAQPINLNYWGCITTAGQIAPAGTYTDTVTMEVRRGGTVYSSATFGVSVINPATCTIAASLGTLSFVYTSFRSTPATASLNISPTCTSQLPYSMTLNAYGGTLVGLNYTLDINSTPPPVASRGTGLAQTHTINGSIAAGQAGTCALASCNASQSHTLTITY